MTRYLLSVYTGTDDAPQQMTEEEMRAGFEQVARLEDEMKAAGALALSARLQGPEKASVVRARKGKVVTTDGPFIEAKESLGGFYIIEAADDEAARGWASKTSAAINMPIEVRPFWDWHA
ncbi:MAG TPA: YciI family protein [Candidatus Limnocylindrales bacterium]|nr:YciI family protein [Candidatus Limnocylindrales bacterium]